MALEGPANASNGKIMAKAIKLTLTEDEIEILVDAMEADLEGYVEAAKEARGNGNRADVATFTEAAQRIQALMTKLQDLIED
jgi:Xaa-Pro aminopeptidase